jgi:hypothetical protein
LLVVVAHNEHVAVVVVVVDDETNDARVAVGELVDVVAADSIVEDNKVAVVDDLHLHLDKMHNFVTSFSLHFKCRQCQSHRTQTVIILSMIKRRCLIILC